MNPQLGDWHTRGERGHGGTDHLGLFDIIADLKDAKALLEELSR